MLWAIVSVYDVWDLKNFRLIEYFFFLDELSVNRRKNDADPCINKINPIPTKDEKADTTGNRYAF